MSDQWRTWWRAALCALGLAFVGAAAAETGNRQVVDGVAVYFGLFPAELVRGHPREHPESGMHGGAPVGESHVLVALFDAKTGRRIEGAAVTATVTGPKRLKLSKTLEPMIVAGALTYGNYFYLTGPGPYRIAVRARLPDAREVTATFTWARS